MIELRRVAAMILAFALVMVPSGLALVAMGRWHEYPMVTLLALYAIAEIVAAARRLERIITGKLQ